MIARYNRKEVLLALLCAAGSAVAYWCAYEFFRFAFTFVAGEFHYRHLAETLPRNFALAVLFLITSSGYTTWHLRGGFYGYEESGLYHRLERVSVGAVVTNRYIRRTTGPAYMLSQLFLAGPMLAMRGLMHWHNRISYEQGQEQRLAEVLALLRRANKWQGLEEYPEHREEILLLARMRHIDFSVAKGSPRLKASAPNDGT